jgi:hypothetical protein
MHDRRIYLSKQLGQIAALALIIRVTKSICNQRDCVKALFSHSQNFYESSTMNGKASWSLL